MPFIELFTHLGDPLWTPVSKEVPKVTEILFLRLEEAILWWRWLKGSSHHFGVPTTSDYPEEVLVAAKLLEYRFARQSCLGPNERNPFDSAV